MNVEFAVCNLARHAGVGLGPDEVSAELRSHPAYPSMLAVAHVLDALGVEHVAAAADGEALADIAPAIAHTTSGLVVVESISKDSARIADETGRRSLSRAELEAIRTGPVIFLEGAGRETHLRRRLVRAYRRRRIARWSARLGALAWLGCLAALAWPDELLALGLVALGVVGLVASAALVGVELGVDSQLGQALCGRGAAQGCDAVLRSPMGELFGVRLAEVGLCFFLVQQVAAALTMAGDGGLTVVAAVSLAAAPVPVLSVLYQALVVRAWCRLCLLVQVVLLAQAALAAGIVLDGPAVSARAVLVAAAGGVAVILAWITTRRAAFLWAGRTQIEVEMARMRRSPQRIAALLETAEELEREELAGDVVRGEPAGLAIELVLSLGCEGCRAAFLELNDLLERFPDSVSARVRFASGASSVEEPPVREAVVRQALDGDHDGAWRTLEDHFRGRSGARHPPAGMPADSEVQRAIEEQEAWRREAGIQVTPTRSFDGRLLDPSVSIADLAHFIALHPRAQPLRA